MTKQESTAHTSRWEWVAAAVSGALVLLIVGVLTAEALAPSSPPQLVARADSVHAGTGIHTVLFTVHNQGTETAAAVTVEGELVAGDSVLERSSATIDYVPGRGSAGGGLVFRRDPAGHALRIAARGYQEP